MTLRERAAWATVLTGVLASTFSGASGPLVWGVGLAVGIVIGFISGVAYMAYLGSVQRGMR